MKIFGINKISGYIEKKKEIEKYINDLLKKGTNSNDSNPTIIFDCRNIANEESFWDEVQIKLTNNCDYFGRNLDALDELIGDGMGGLFQSPDLVNVAIINLKTIFNKPEIVSLITGMLDVIISRFVYEIKTEEYCYKYINNVKRKIKDIYREDPKYISLRLYENDII